jgi:hypothetical protein
MVVIMMLMSSMDSCNLPYVLWMTIKASGFRFSLQGPLHSAHSPDSRLVQIYMASESRLLIENLQSRLKIPDLNIHHATPVTSVHNSQPISLWVKKNDWIQHETAGLCNGLCNVDNNHNITWHVLLVVLLTLLQQINTWWICNLPLFRLSSIQCQNFRLCRVKRDLKVNHTLRSLFCMIKCFPKLEKNLVGTQSLFFLVPNFAQMSKKKVAHALFLRKPITKFQEKSSKIGCHILIWILLWEHSFRQFFIFWLCCRNLSPK